MLDNNNHNNSLCAFSGQAVDFLYGEISALEKVDFETHLKACSICAEEFAGLGAARSSVIEWRNEDFMFLETPSIEIPYETPRKIYSSETAVKNSHWWLANFRKFFSLSPALNASAALALIVFCVGVVFFTVKPLNNTEIAGSNNKDSEQPLVASSNDRQISSNEKLLVPSADKKDNDYKTFSEPKTLRKDSIVKVVDNLRASTKTSIQTVKLPKIKTANVESRKPLFAQTGKIPRLNNVEEVEDKSLRLAELLDDSDAR